MASVERLQCPPAAAAERRPPSDARWAGWLATAEAVGRRYHFRTADPRRHNVLNLGALLLVAAGYAGVTALGVAAGSWYALPALGLAYGWLDCVLLILVVHEAAHNMFLLGGTPRQRVRLNRLLGAGVAALFGVDYRTEWQRGHLRHHADPVRPHDPQNCVAPVGAALVRHCLRTLLPGYLLLVALRRPSTAPQLACPEVGPRPARPAWLWAMYLGAWGGVTAAAVALGHAVIPAALALGLQVASVWNLIKIALEHGGEAAGQADPRLRSRSTELPLRHLLLPLNIGLHFEHHLNMGVPWYRLGAFHRELRAALPAEAQRVLFRRPGKTPGAAEVREPFARPRRSLPWFSTC